MTFPNRSLLVQLLVAAVLFQFLHLSTQDVVVEVINEGVEELIVKIVDSDTGTFMKPNEVIYFPLADSSSNLICARLAKCETRVNCSYSMTAVGLMLQVNTPIGLSDYYGVSVVEGYNRGAKIEPLDTCGCEVSSCSLNLEQDCPEDHKINLNEETVSCGPNSNLYSNLCPTAVSSHLDALYYCNATSYRITLW